MLSRLMGVRTDAVENEDCAIVAAGLVGGCEENGEVEADELNCVVDWPCDTGGEPINGLLVGNIGMVADRIGGEKASAGDDGDWGWCFNKD